MISNLPKKPPPSYLVTLGLPFAFLFTIFSFRRVGFNFQDFRENLENRAIVTDPLFNPKWAWAWENTAEALLETVQIAILASIVGCAFALPLAFYASRATNLNKYSYFIYKSFLNLVRTIPDLFWAMLFTVAVGIGPFAGVLALIMFSWILIICSRSWTRVLVLFLVFVVILKSYSFVVFAVVFVLWNNGKTQVKTTTLKRKINFCVIG